MFSSLFAFSICLIAAVFQAIQGNVALCALECFLVFINAPGAFSYMEKKGWIKGEEKDEEDKP